MDPVLSAKLANRYEVASELGRGGMGVVYRARDPMLNRDVAVKLIGSSELTAEIEERFQREAQIVPLFHEQVYHFVRPEVEGHSLGFALPTVAYENLSVRK